MNQIPGTRLLLPLRHVLVGLLVSSAPFATHLSGQEPRFAPDFPIRLESVEIVGNELGFGVLIDGELGPGGSVYLADMSNSKIIVLDPSSHVRWREGGKGKGPGEFETLYRITVGPDGTVYVLDRYGNSITRISADGKFIDRRPVEFLFSTIDDFVVAKDGRIVMSGITTYGLPSDSAVHVFDADLRYLRSFAPLPPAEKPGVLAYYGAGGLTLTPDGELFYVRRLPYEIYHYTLDGERLGVIEAPFYYDVTPDDAVLIQERPGGLRFCRPDVMIPRFQPPRSLGGSWIMTGRLEGEDRYWDIFAKDGRHLGSTPVPKDWGTVLGYDAERGVIWAKGRHLLEPVLRRLTVHFP